MADDKTNSTNIRVNLTDVRLSYPHLWQKHAFEDNAPKYGSGFIIDPSKKSGAKNVDMLDAAIAKVQKAAGIKKLSKTCFNEGSEDAPEQEGMMYLSTGNKGRPTVVDRDRSPLTEDDGRPYGGCYVNAIVTVYAMPKYKGVFATLEGVQFLRDGEAFGSAPLSEDAFDDLGDEEDEAPAKKRRPSRDEEEEEEAPRKKRRAPVDEEEEEAPRKKRRPPVDEEEEEEAPRRKKRPSRDDDDDAI